jgi:hypothetical protein
MSTLWWTVKRHFFLAVLAFSTLFTLTLSPLQVSVAYAQQQLISLNVEAGYDSYFRADYWTPLLVSITNNGDPIEGKLITRQERNDALTNTFSTPISLPSGAQQNFFLYVTLRTFGTSLLVEVLDQNDVIAAELEVPIRNVASRDRIRAVVTTSPNSPINLIQTASGGNQVFQVNWFTENIPDNVEALRGIESMIFSDVDTGTLTTAQRAAVEHWILLGGHAIFTGGSNWQPAVSAFESILPLDPTGTQQVTALGNLPQLAGNMASELTGTSTITVGDLREGSTVLASTESNEPLYARTSYGSGTVDYLTADLSTEPLRSWTGLSQMWFTLFTSIDARPGWSSGFSDIDSGIDSIQILPGFSALPEATAMLGFLVIYILLVGPLNYIILNRLNRRELAWVSIPVLIIIFSILAWATGFNLRGNDVVLSRLSAIRVWPEQETAYAEQLIGLLAPRRGNYSLGVSDDRVLRPVMRTGQTNQIFGGTTESTEIVEATSFNAMNFPVDASFIAAFESSGVLPAPEISGRISIAYSQDGLNQTLRGTIRNDSEFALNSPVLLARGIAFELPQVLNPGDLYVLDEENFVLEDTGPAAAAPIEYSLGEKFNSYNSYYRYGASSDGVVRNTETLRNIFTTSYVESELGYLTATPNADQELLRRQKFLNALIDDQFSATARANNVYLVAWSDQAPFNEDVGSASWRAIDSTAYIVQLPVDLEVPQSEVLVSGDQFTWVALQRESALDASPTNSTLYSDSIVSFRFTPLPSAVLSNVDTLYVTLDQDGNLSRSRDMTIELWNWRTQTWEPMDITEGRNRIAERELYLGPLNAVQVRINRDLSGGGYFYIRQLTVEQEGTF